MMRIKAAVFDLDDTVLRDDLSISQYTRSVFHRLHSKGFVFVAASGRTQMSMKPFVDFLGCTSLYISCNGAEIWDSSTDQLLHRETFSAELGREIARFGKEYSCYAQTYSEDRFFFNEYSVYSERYSASSMLPGEYVGDLETYIREPRSKILMMADEQKISQMMKDAAARFDGRVSVTCSKPYFLEFTPLLATKGIALGRAAALLGLTESDFIAFGDSLNDASMLRAAGFSVAVANARSEVIDLCSDACLSNMEDGVARYLDSVITD